MRGCPRGQGVLRCGGDVYTIGSARLVASFRSAYKFRQILIWRAVLFMIVGAGLVPAHQRNNYEFAENGAIQLRFTAGPAQGRPLRSPFLNWQIAV